jgi:hypothetical protein
MQDKELIYSTGEVALLIKFTIQQNKNIQYGG